jgi:hypothetical protein
MTTKRELQAEIRENRRLIYVHMTFVTFIVALLMAFLTAQINIIYSLIFTILALLAFIGGYGNVLVMDGKMSDKYLSYLPYWNTPAKRLDKVMDDIVMEEQK